MAAGPGWGKGGTMRVKALLILLVVVASLLPLAAADLRLNPGKWEITLTPDVKGMPMALKPMTYTACLTSDKPVPIEPQQRGICKLRDTKVEGNTVTWALECEKDGRRMQGNGKITYSGDGFAGDNVMTTTTPGAGAIEMVVRMKGQRLGPCEK